MWSEAGNTYATIRQWLPCCNLVVRWVQCHALRKIYIHNTDHSDWPWGKFSVPQCYVINRVLGRVPVHLFNFVKYTNNEFSTTTITDRNYNQCWVLILNRSYRPLLRSDEIQNPMKLKRRTVIALPYPCISIGWVLIMKIRIGLCQACAERARLRTVRFTIFLCSSSLPVVSAVLQSLTLFFYTFTPLQERDRQVITEGHNRFKDISSISLG